MVAMAEGVESQGKVRCANVRCENPYVPAYYIDSRTSLCIECVCASGPVSHEWRSITGTALTDLQERQPLRPEKQKDAKSKGKGIRRPKPEGVLMATIVRAYEQKANEILAGLDDEALLILDLHFYRFLTAVEIGQRIGRGKTFVNNVVNRVCDLFEQHGLPRPQRPLELKPRLYSMQAVAAERDNAHVADASDIEARDEQIDASMLN